MVGGGINIDGCWLCRSRLTSGCVGRSNFQPAFGSGCVSLMVLRHVLGPALGVVSLHLFGLGLPLWPLACRCCIPPFWLVVVLVARLLFASLSQSLGFPSPHIAAVSSPLLAVVLVARLSVQLARLSVHLARLSVHLAPLSVRGCVTLHFLLAGKSVTGLSFAPHCCHRTFLCSTLLW